MKEKKENMTEGASYTVTKIHGAKYECSKNAKERKVR